MPPAHAPRAWPRRALPALACAAALFGLSGCWFSTEVGESQPPIAFGPFATAPAGGCPSLQGVYLWPPVRAEHPGHLKGMDLVAAWDGDLPTRVSRVPGQIWITDRPGELLVRSRPAGQRMMDDTVRYWGPTAFTGPHAQGWYTATYHRADCSHRLVELSDERPTDDQTPRSGRLARLARMADGSLAVGIRTRQTDLTLTITGWEYSVIATLPAPDEVSWTWWLLRAAGDGATEPGAPDPEWFDAKGRVR